MWKRGVVKRGRTMSRELAAKRGIPRRFSLTLFTDLERPRGPEDEALLDRLYDELIVGGNVHKTTRKDRFRELDRRLVDEVLARFPGNDVVTIHDAGVSSGVTSVELFRQFEGRRRVKVDATDLYDSIYFVEVAGRGWTVVFSADRNPLQYVGHGFVLSALAHGYNHERRRYPINRALKRRLDVTLLPEARRLLTAASFVLGSREYSGEQGRVTRFPLLHPECRALLEKTTDFTFSRRDIFETTVHRYHVVRALNVLTPYYFSAERLKLGIAACGQGLRDGGVLVIGRSIEDQDGRSSATAFARMGSRLEPIWDLHEGAEIRSLVEEVRLRDWTDDRDAETHASRVS